MKVSHNAPWYCRPTRLLGRLAATSYVHVDLCGVDLPVLAVHVLLPVATVVALSLSLFLSKLRYRTQLSPSLRWSNPTHKTYAGFS